MALWFNLNCNDERIGQVEIRRREHLGLSNPPGIRDAVSTYDLRRDGELVGAVKHRYGDGAGRLLGLAADLIEQEASVFDPSWRPAPWRKADHRNHPGHPHCCRC